jgi:hypothetical protein
MRAEFILTVNAITETVVIQCAMCTVSQDLGNPMLTDAILWARTHVCKM